MGATIPTEEPSSPSVKTAIPGPKSKKCLDEIDKVFDAQNASIVVDYTKSFGNYIVDPDNNQFLDV